MSLFYDLILEMKYGLQDNEYLNVSLINSNVITIKPADKLMCIDDIVTISKDKRQCKLFNLKYVCNVGIFKRGFSDADLL